LLSPETHHRSKPLRREKERKGKDREVTHNRQSVTQPFAHFAGDPSDVIPQPTDPPPDPYSVFTPALQWVLVFLCSAFLITNHSTFSLEDDK
jgi:hypothetical protein